MSEINNEDNELKSYRFMTLMDVIDNPDEAVKTIEALKEQNKNMKEEMEKMKNNKDDFCIIKLHLKVKKVDVKWFFKSLNKILNEMNIKTIYNSSPYKNTTDK